jgi:hypothetical protein
MLSNSAKNLATDPPRRLPAIGIGQPRSAPWRVETIRTGIFREPIATPLLSRRHGIEGNGQEAERGPLPERLTKQRPTLRP